jgi:hypothetical protein
MSKAQQILQLAETLAHEDATFFRIAGPGAGDHRTNAYVAELRSRATAYFGHDFSEARICGDTGLRVDYFLPDEHTIVEIAFSLRNSASEFERDILKAVVAQESGCDVRRLVFLCKPGGEARHQAPASRAFMNLVHARHGIVIEIHDIQELEGVTAEADDAC